MVGFSLDEIRISIGLTRLELALGLSLIFIDPKDPMIPFISQKNLGSKFILFQEANNLGDGLLVLVISNNGYIQCLFCPNILFLSIDRAIIIWRNRLNQDFFHHRNDGPYFTSWDACNIGTYRIL